MDNMNPAVAAAVSAELAKHFDKVKDVIGEAQKEIDGNKRVSEGMKDTISKLNTDGAAIVVKQKALEDEATKTGARLLDLEQKLAERGKGGGRPEKQKSLGEQLSEDPNFVEFAKEFANSTRPGRMKQRFHTKNITSSSATGGPGAFPEYLPTPVIPNFMPLAFRDLLAQGTTESNLIYWVKENVFTNNAGYQGSDGSLKPQSDISYVTQNIPVETIAHWFKASKQILADFKMLQSLINQRATFGLKYAEERELLYGDGTTGHLHGVVPQATAYNQGYLTGDTKLDTIRRAMLQVTLAFYPATGIALSPADWADIELTKDSYGRYMIGNPATGGMPKMLWGLPVAECFNLQRGDFLVGAFKLAAMLFDREEASILVSTEDQDNFVRNMVTILSEERLALAVSRPAAIIYGDFKSGETG